MIICQERTLADGADWDGLLAPIFLRSTTPAAKNARFEIRFRGSLNNPRLFAHNKGQGSKKIHFVIEAPAPKVFGVK
jgi:hypothetical protein